MEGLRENSKVRGVNLGGWLVIEGWIKPSLFDDILNGDMLVSSYLHIFSCLCSHLAGNVSWLILLFVEDANIL